MGSNISKGDTNKTWTYQLGILFSKIWMEPMDIGDIGIQAVEDAKLKRERAGEPDSDLLWNAIDRGDHRPILYYIYVPKSEHIVRAQYTT